MDVASIIMVLGHWKKACEDISVLILEVSSALYDGVSEATSTLMCFLFENSVLASPPH